MILKQFLPDTDVVNIVSTTLICAASIVVIGHGSSL